ncbi:hypothetical protein PR202_ga29582 [Eleusine coracana subsp. coracana]|uniref:F-box domain-containing protein n=1 Tax=Eleusine coracana subsp. coracana TaxID=191504 RepID=A0AAV5DNB5_ELECO|nr:hypothetical protein PR202_ga29582 [Eleusine coracana subsp. coracana]
MASLARPNPHHAESPAPPLRRLTDELLVVILIRLPTLADIGRASAACPAFHRVITDRSFLRRIRAVHPPLLLGTHMGTHSSDFLPAMPPHPPRQLPGPSPALSTSPARSSPLTTPSATSTSVTAMPSSLESLSRSYPLAIAYPLTGTPSGSPCHKMASMTMTVGSATALRADCRGFQSSTHGGRRSDLARLDEKLPVQLPGSIFFSSISHPSSRHRLSTMLARCLGLVGLLRTPAS